MTEGEGRGVEAVFLDLYGTLLRIERPRIARDLPRMLDIPSRPWVRLVREELLVRPCADREEFVERVLSLAPRPAPDAGRRAADLVDEELASIVTCPGVGHVLRFLKRRGHVLGLVSNLTALHEEPLHRHGLAELFDDMALSFEEGVRKPDRRIYLALCRRLDVEPEAVLFVGDSLAADVRAPRELGMRVLRIGGDEHGEAIPSIDRLGWVGPLERGRLEPVVPPGARVRLGGRPLVLGAVEPLEEETQGRYNLVARVDLREGDHEARKRPVCKRFQSPDSVRVEHFARGIMALADLPCGDAELVGDDEACLLMSPVPGHELGQVEDVELAREVGRHCAAGWVFANADLRPRNAFVDWTDTGPRITMIDLELIFFNLALDLDGLDDPFRPETFDRLSEQEVRSRLRREVLTHRTTRRAMRSFLVPESPDSERGRAFRDGWLRTYRLVQRRRQEILGRIRERVHDEPPLIIGTRSYRRAMADIDVDDMARRIDADPERLFPRLATFQERPRAHA
ncbi:MAG: HAD family hydrolase [Acidobacteriota bacterium]